MITEFTHPELPGMTGVTWGGQAFTVFPTLAKAQAAAEILSGECGELGHAVAVSRSDGKALVAVLDHEDGTFFYAKCSRAPA